MAQMQQVDLAIIKRANGFECSFFSPEPTSNGNRSTRPPKTRCDEVAHDQVFLPTVSCQAADLRKKVIGRVSTLKVHAP